MRQRMWVILCGCAVLFVLAGCKGEDSGSTSGKAGDNASESEESIENDASLCTGKRAKSCLILGVDYQTGANGKNKDVARALKLFEMTCDGGDDARGCTLAANVHKAGKDGIAKNEKKALELYEKACLTAGDKYGCYHAGNAYGIEMLGTKRDDKKAFKYHTKACEKGEKDSCKFAGMLEKSVKKPTPEQQIDTCLKEKHIGSCNTVAHNARQGKNGFERDYKKAAAMLAISCGEKKDKLGCTLLGLMHEKGEITGTPEKAQVEAAYVTACAAGGAIACRTLGKHYLLGRLLDKDPSKAKPLLEKACAAGDASGCTWLAVIYRNGFGVPRDLAKAQALLKTACDDGDKSACKALDSAK